ncbi:type II toxin-antitoxin system PemK/MazF family toxin [Thermodesulfobacteriota bacterium B35]
MTYKKFDVVVVPFPFTDQSTTKRRPALVLSGNDSFHRETENCVLAMITSERNPPWPLDSKIGSLKKSGLSAPSVVRMKLFTLDARLIIRKIGALAAKDQKTVTENLTNLLG